MVTYRAAVGSLLPGDVWTVSALQTCVTPAAGMCTLSIRSIGWKPGQEPITKLRLYEMSG